MPGHNWRRWPAFDGGRIRITSYNVCYTKLLRFETDERPAADEENVARVDLDEVLLRMFAAALGGNVRDRPLQDLKQRLLDPFAGRNNFV